MTLCSLCHHWIFLFLLCGLIDIPFRSAPVFPLWGNLLKWLRTFYLDNPTVMSCFDLKFGFRTQDNTVLELNLYHAVHVRNVKRNMNCPFHYDNWVCSHNCLSNFLINSLFLLCDVVRSRKVNFFRLFLVTFFSFISISRIFLIIHA